MKRKTILAISLLAVCMIFALAGCGSSDEAAAGDPQTSETSQAAGSDISFTTTDLDGNTVDSAELFAQNKITMINIWGTYCGPCIEEMPELQKISKEYADKGAAIVGLVVDVPEGDDAELATARSILKDTGVTYLNLRTWDGFSDQFGVQFIPMTYFVDSQGNLIGDPVIGADVVQYRTALDQFLQQ